MTDPVLDMLLRDVVAHPDDDVPRLAYADRLEETGADDARAEFIRVQCAPPRAARHREPYIPGCSCPACGPVGRVRQLVGLYGVRWLGVRVPVPAPSRPWKSYDVSVGWWPDFFFRYERGFVAYCRLPWPAWRRSGPALCRLHPLTCVRLSWSWPERCAGPSGLWRWNTGGDPGRPDQVPLELYRLLRGDGTADGYPGVAAAREALGAAALAWAAVQPAARGAAP